jgi:hypothetical protein
MEIKSIPSADVVEIQEAVTDELKKVQKEEFSAAFQKMYDSAKACIYANGACFEFGKRYYLPLVSPVVFQISPKNLDPTV